MHRRFPILVTLALLSAALPAQTPHTIRIEPLRNEKWWGLFAGGGPAQPFAAPFDSSNCDSCGTFTIPFMISSGGRMMWSSAPADVVFDGSLFTVTPSGTQPTVAKGGRTLREAYLYCVHKYAWPKGTAPARHPFMRPVYDTGLSEALIAAGGTALLAAADSITAHGYPPGLLLIPDGWQDNSGEGGLDRNLYASFRDTADELTRRGFDVMFTVTPYIPAAGQRYIEARRKGMLLEDAEGRPAVIRLPSGYYACLDVTLPEVTAYFGELLDNLRKEGITALRFDCHRALDILPPGERTERYLTAWAALGERYGAAMYPLAEQTQTQWRPYSVALSPEISWESMRRALTDAIHAGLTGHIYPYLSLTSSAGHCSDETMLLRAVQLALFMPIAAVPPDGSLFPTGTCRKGDGKGRGAAHGDERLHGRAAARGRDDGRTADAPHGVPIPRTGILGLYGPIHARLPIPRRAGTRRHGPTNRKTAARNMDIRRRDPLQRTTGDKRGCKRRKHPPLPAAITRQEKEAGSTAIPRHEGRWLRNEKEKTNGMTNNRRMV